MATDVYYSSVSLLLHLNTNFTDKSPSPHTVTSVGSPTLSTTQSVFGGGSFRSIINNTGNFTLDGSSAFAFNADYTIEMWLYSDAASQTGYIYDHRPASTTGAYPVLYLSGGILKYAQTSAAFDIVDSVALTLNTWYHVAISRVGSSVKMFKNGVQAGSTFTDSTSLSVGASRPVIDAFGFNPANNTGFSGYIDDLRVTKGVGRYTTTFSIPTEEFYLRDPITITTIGSSNITVVPDSVARKLLVYSILGSSLLTSIPASSIAVIRSVLLSENLNSVDALSFYTTISLYESLLYSEIVSNSENANSYILEYINIIDSIVLAFLIGISDNINILDSLSNILSNIESVIELLISQDNISSLGSLLSSLLEVINYLDTSEISLSASIVESLVNVDTTSVLFTLVSTIIDAIITTDSTSNIATVITVLSDSTILSESNSASLSAVSSILDKLIISIPTVSGQEVYYSYLLSPETNSISTYDNYNFDSSTKFNGDYLFCNKDGLFKYGGVLDDTSKITSYIETVAYNFNSSNLKQVPSVYLGVSSTGTFILKVRVDGKSEVIYKLNKNTNNLQTQKVDIGKGLIGRFFQFELITDADTFNIESVEFYPIELKRKL